MGVSDIKAELRELIENETDNRILEDIKTLLTKSSLNPELKEKLTSRALKSEQNIKDGKVYARQEAESKLRSQLGL